MSAKPSDLEDEYFVREEIERRRKLAQERQAAVLVEDRERERTLHHMRCPKCGMKLEEMKLGSIRLDKCFECEGLWLDKGELEQLQGKDAGFVRRMLALFHP